MANDIKGNFIIFPKRRWHALPQRATGEASGFEQEKAESPGQNLYWNFCGKGKVEEGK